MNGGQIMVVVIVAMALLAGVLKARYGHGRRRGHIDQDGNGRAAAAEAAEAQRLRDEVKQLKERLAVIERITVEKESSLEREIERLRDR
jgi:uncharacterized protein YlxW (UPF0749 family)